MKKVIATVLAATLGLSLYAADIFAFSPIKGSVKNYTQTEFSIASKFGSYYRTPLVKTTHVFNGAGQDIESTELSPKDTVLNKISTTYDAAGNVTEQVCCNADGNLIWKTITSYKNGKKDSCSEYDEKGTLKAKIIYTYSGDNLVDETGYNGDGVLVWKTITKYDELNRISVISSYCGDGTLNEEETYTYSDSGLLDTVSVYDSFSDSTIQKVFRYSDTTLNEITTYSKDKIVKNRTIFKYDTIGNPIKVSEYNIANKFGTTVNELISMSEVSYNY